MTSLPSHGSVCRIVQHAIAGIVLAGMTLMSTASAQPIKAGDIAPFEVEYEVGNNLISAGTAHLVLSKEGDTWTYSLNTRPRGVFKLAGKGRIEEQSTFVMEGSGDNIQLQPQSYMYRQDNEKRRQVDASFDWEEQLITHAYRGEEITETFNEPVLDRLAATLYIMNALRNDFTEAELPIFDSGRIKQVQFINEGMEILKTPLGDVETLRVVNRNATGGSRETRTWFAPSLDYLPVKIEHLKRGDLVARMSLLNLHNRVTSLELGGALPVNPDSEAALEEAERLLLDEDSDSE